MPLDDTGVRLVLAGYNQFISGMNNATNAVSNFGIMTKNRIAAISLMGQAAAQMGAQAAKAAESLSKVAVADAKLAVAEQKTTQTGNQLARSQEFTKQRTLELAAATVNFKTKLVENIANILKLVIAHKQASTAVQENHRSMLDWMKTLVAAQLVAKALQAAISWTTQKIKDMAKAAFESAADLQYLTIRIENLLARQYRMGDATLSVADSMAIASKRAGELTDWMAQLAITTPFGTQTISETTSMALAMGWSEEEAKDLTKAIVDYAAAMGLGNDQMDRIIFNFAQMRAAGKVTATEMRDLARGAFFPLEVVLDEAAKQLGIATDGLLEFRKQAADGTIDVETFFNAFITVVNRDFPDAAQKMNITFAAVQDNLRDLFQVLLGWKLLGPVVAKAALTISKGIAQINTAFQSGGWVKLADGLVFVFDSLVDAAKNFFGAIGDIAAAMGFSMPTVKQWAQVLAALGIIIKDLGQGFRNFVDKYIVPFVTKVKEFFEGLIGDAFGWGSDFITEFANGIVETAVTIISAAMEYISKILESWLAPGSPPKIVAQIDEWGAEAMAEFLHGFTLVDFDILDSVQGALEDALQALVDLSMLDEAEFGSLFLGMSEDLIEAIHNFRETGEIGEEIFEQLRDVGGGFGEELAILLERQLSLADAIQAAADAQEELNAAQDATKDATKQVNSLVREYNAMLRAGESKAVLDAKLAEINAAEEELKLAREREAQAEENVDAAEAALAPLREAVELQERLIAQLVELAKVQAEAWEGAGGGGDEGGGGEDGGWEEPPGGENIKKKLDNWWEAIKKSMMDKLGSAWKDLLDTWKKAIEDTDLFKKATELWDKIKGYLTQIWDNLKTAWGNLMTFWEKYGPGIMENLSEAFWTLVGAVAGLILEIGLFLSEVALDWSQWLLDNGPKIEAFSGYVATLVTRIGELAISIWEDLKPGLWQWSETFQTGFTTFLDLVNSESFQNIIDNIFNLAENLGKLAGWLLELAGVLVEHALIKFGEWWIENGDNVAVIVNNTADSFGNFVDSLVVDEQHTSAWDSFLENLSYASGIFVAALAGDTDQAKTLLENWKTFLQEDAAEVDEITLQQAEDIGNWASGIATGLGNAFLGAFNSLKEWLNSISDAVVAWWNTEVLPEIQNAADEFGNWIGGIATNIATEVGKIPEYWETGWQTIWDAMSSWFLDIADKIAEWLNGIIESVTGFVDNFNNIGQSLIQGLIDGVGAMGTALTNAVVQLVQDAIDAILKLLGISSPSTLFADIGSDMIAGMIQGIEDAEGGLVAALEGLFDDLDIEDIFKLGGKFSSFGSSLVSMYQKQTIDPLEDEADNLDERIKDLQDLIASGTLGMYAQQYAEQQLVDLMQQRSDLADEIAEREQKILEFQEQQQKLDFLKQQMDLLKTIEEYGLDPATILGGLELGMDASIEDLLEAMTRAMEAIVAQAEQTLEAGSPSKVFMRLGQGVTQGFAQGVLGTAHRGQQAIGAMLGMGQQVSARSSYNPIVQAQPVTNNQNVSFGNVYINDRMDWVTFRSQVQRAVMEH